MSISSYYPYNQRDKKHINLPYSKDLISQAMKKQIQQQSGQVNCHNNIKQTKKIRSSTSINIQQNEQFTNEATQGKKQSKEQQKKQKNINENEKNKNCSIQDHKFESQIRDSKEEKISLDLAQNIYLNIKQVKQTKYQPKQKTQEINDSKLSQKRENRHIQNKRMQIQIQKRNSTWQNNNQTSRSYENKNSSIKFEAFVRNISVSSIGNKKILRGTQSSNYSSSKDKKQIKVSKQLTSFQYYSVKILDTNYFEKEKQKSKRLKEELKQQSQSNVFDTTKNNPVIFKRRSQCHLNEELKQNSQIKVNNQISNNLDSIQDLIIELGSQSNKLKNYQQQLNTQRCNSETKKEIQKIQEVQRNKQNQEKEAIKITLPIEKSNNQIQKIILQNPKNQADNIIQKKQLDQEKPLIPNHSQPKSIMNQFISNLLLNVEQYQKKLPQEKCQTNKLSVITEEKNSEIREDLKKSYIAPRQSIKNYKMMENISNLQTQFYNSHQHVRNISNLSQKFEPIEKESKLAINQKKQKEGKKKIKLTNKNKLNALKPKDQIKKQNLINKITSSNQKTKLNLSSKSIANIQNHGMNKSNKKIDLTFNRPSEQIITNFHKKTYSSQFLTNHKKSLSNTLTQFRNIIKLFPDQQINKSSRINPKLQRKIEQSHLHSKSVNHYHENSPTSQRMSSSAKKKGLSKWYENLSSQKKQTNRYFQSVREVDKYATPQKQLVRDTSFINKLQDLEKQIEQTKKIQKIDQNVHNNNHNKSPSLSKRKGIFLFSPNLTELKTINLLNKQTISTENNEKQEKKKIYSIKIFEHNTNNIRQPIKTNNIWTSYQKPVKFTYIRAK